MHTTRPRRDTLKPSVRLALDFGTGVAAPEWCSRTVNTTVLQLLELCVLLQVRINFRKCDETQAEHSKSFLMHNTVTSQISRSKVILSVASTIVLSAECESTLLYKT
eukprot:1233070-Amphidinium_carterae.1